LELKREFAVTEVQLAKAEEIGRLELADRQDLFESPAVVG
jgi:hypothetical protein